MIVTQAQFTPIVAIVAGILILIVPRLLNYIVALYLIFIGFVQLNATHHWVRFGMATRLRPAIVLVQNQPSPKPVIHVMASPNPQSTIHDRVNQHPMLETV